MSRWTPSDLANYQAQRRAASFANVTGLETVSAPKPNKYHAKKTEVDGVTFDSKREATRYQELKLMEHFGMIRDLKLQVPYLLIVNRVKIGKYVADFEYQENGQRVIEDSKGIRTPAYRLKKKLMLALHSIEIRET